MTYVVHHVIFNKKYNL